MAENYEESKLYRLRHSAAHVMAQAVLEKFPEGKVAIGPPVEDGFYYDFDLPRPLTPEDLEEIEARMREIVKANQPFIREEVSAEQAREIFDDQPYKLALIDGLETGGVDEHGNPVEEKPVISIYKSDTFVDLCRGPHLERTGEINPKAVKLMNVAGAYWRGDEHNPMLQRIYGTAWLSPKDLKDYLWRLEEAKKRDHRRLGKELDLFSVSDEVGAGLVLWHPMGSRVRHIAERFWEDEHITHGYEFVYTPHIGKADLWKTSGHLDFYAENMYAPIEIERPAVLPQADELPLPHRDL
jgi:threonyl-tRNA synthetase